MALFATMTFAFTACGDDDEPDGGGNNKGVVGELTIDGTKTSFYYIQGENTTDQLHKFDYDAALWRKDGEILSIQIYEDIFKFSKGEDLSDRVTVLPTFGKFGGGHILESGSITLTDIDSKYITLTFDNAVVKEFSGYHDPLTIDGTIKLPIDGEMGSLKNIEGYEWI